MGARGRKQRVRQDAIPEEKRKKNEKKSKENLKDFNDRLIEEQQKLI